jgi:hypothetical protein
VPLVLVSAQAPVQQVSAVVLVSAVVSALRRQGCSVARRLRRPRGSAPSWAQKSPVRRTQFVTTRGTTPTT